MTLKSYFILCNEKCTSSLAKKSKKCQKHPVDRLPHLVVHQTCAKKVVRLTLAGPTLRVFKQPRRNFYLINWIADIDTLSRVAQKYCCPFVSIRILAFDLPMHAWVWNTWKRCLCSIFC